MKQRIIAYTLPLLFIGSVSQAAPIELFEQDYKTITQTVLDNSGLSIFKGRDLIIEGITRSDNVADFEAKSTVVFNDKEQLKIEEVGEVVFTNYAENKGVATVISKSDYAVHSEIDGEDTILMKAKGITTQSQIDRENLHFKFSSQFPTLEMVNPDTEKPGIIHIEGLIGEGKYGFKDNFEKIDTLKGTYKTDKIIVEVDDGSSAVKIDVANALIDTELNYAENLQKSIFELNDIEVLSRYSNETSATKVNLGNFSYHTGADIREDAPAIFAELRVKDLKIVPKESELVTEFGDFSFDMIVTPLVADLFEKLSAAGINDFSNLDASYQDAYALLKEFLTDNSAIEFQLDGKLGDHHAKKFLSITPKAALIDKLASIDINDDAAMDQVFAGLTFFEFVEKYITAIDLDITSSKAYILEFGSNVLLASGEEATMPAARKSMQEFYQQMQLLAVMFSADAPLVEFTTEGLRVHIQYKDQVWIVNGKEMDLEAIASLFN